MIHISWGDDEHTAVEGAYSRLLKSRKWLLAAGTFALVLSGGYLQVDKLNQLLGVIHIPEAALRTSAILALGYMLIQYFAITFQLWRGYPEVLEERLLGAQEKEIADRRQKLTGLEAEADAWRLAILDKTTAPPAAAALSQEQRMGRLKAVEQRVGVANLQIARLIQSDPMRKPGYTEAEKLIDIFRVGFPLAFALVALERLIWLPC